MVDHADLPSDPAGMNHIFAFTAPLPPGEYAVRFNVGGVQKGNLGFVIDAPTTPAAPPLSLQIRVMGNLVTEGQKLNKRDPEYPKPGFIGPNDITATIVSTAVPPVAPGTPVRLEWLKDGVSLAPPVDVTAEDIGKALPFSSSPKGPDPGNYSAKLTVEGQDTLVNFTIVGATAPPPPPPQTGTVPTEKKPQPDNMRGLLTFEIWSRTCQISPTISTLKPTMRSVASQGPATSSPASVRKTPLALRLCGRPCCLVTSTGNETDRCRL